jgi:hypothetical protein
MEVFLDVTSLITGKSHVIDLLFFDITAERDVSVICDFYDSAL